MRVNLDGGIRHLTNTVPFNNNAAEQWLPAIDQASEYARSKGLRGIEYEGTGILARGLEIMVNAIEVQKLFAIDASGQRHEIGQTLPEASHLTALKSTDALVAEFKAMIDAHLEANQPAVVPFKANAAEQWLPAIKAADEYARSLGYRGLTYEGTGALARGLAVNVNAIELQKIVLIDADGVRHGIGEVIPEAQHVSTLKSTATLTKEFRSLIDRFHLESQSRNARSLTSGPETRSFDAYPTIGRPRRAE